MSEPFHQLLLQRSRGCSTNLWRGNQLFIPKSSNILYKSITYHMSIFLSTKSTNLKLSTKMPRVKLSYNKKPRKNVGEIDFRGQFHQHSLQILLSKKSTNLKCKQKKICKNLLYKKAAHKMLVKLTSGPSMRRRPFWELQAHVGEAAQQRDKDHYQLPQEQFGSCGFWSSILLHLLSVIITGHSDVFLKPLSQFAETKLFFRCLQ
jgi:hypothetical protein